MPHTTTKAAAIPHRMVMMELSSSSSSPLEDGRLEANLPPVLADLVGFLAFFFPVPFPAAWEYFFPSIGTSLVRYLYSNKMVGFRLNSSMSRSISAAD